MFTIDPKILWKFANFERRCSYTEFANISLDQATHEP